MIASNVVELIGNTPMVEIRNMKHNKNVRLLAKLEGKNPGGSVKDRMAKYLIEYAESFGKLDKSKTILEATSGNTGIGLAMVAAAKGYKIAIIMPESVSVERRKIIKALGAELILSPGEKGTGGAVELKQNMLKESPNQYIDIDQFKDPANILAHYQTTGREILEQTGGDVDVIVVGVGTAGTGVGISMRVKEFSSKIKVIGIMPKLGTAIQGLRNPGEPYPTQLFRREKFDEIIEISKEEVPKTFEITRSLAQHEGLFLGMSSGAIMYAALKIAEKLKKGTVVAVLPDGGEKYLSTPLFGE